MKLTTIYLVVDRMVVDESAKGFARIGYKILSHHATRAAAENALPVKNSDRYEIVPWTPPRQVVR